MTYIQQTITDLKLSSPAQSEFYQAVEEVLHSLEPALKKEPSLTTASHYPAHS